MDLPACRQMIARLTSATDREQVDLPGALARVTAADLTARLPQPGFRQSLRDGYVLTQATDKAAPTYDFPVVGMIRAGDTATMTLAPGQACRIMTGAMVPAGGVRVIPQEECTVEDGIVRVPGEAMAKRPGYIQEEGSEIAVGEAVVRAGTVLQPEHLALLAAVGRERVEVFRRPKVCFFCTGSELVESGRELRPGQKISSNRHLLEGLVHRYGGEADFLGTVADTRTALARTFARLKTTPHDLAISTGGMGPGKYDLIEQAFLEAGGRVSYDSLDLIPGKNSLCGTLDGRIFFGLPGPPMAVHALLSAIVGPALLRMQGIPSPSAEPILAHLDHPLAVRRPGVMLLSAGVLSSQHGRCLVRLTEKKEPPSCYLVIPADRTSYARDELIEVLPTATPFGPVPL